MQTQIQSYYLDQKTLKPITIFGHSSKSLPGLEIIGLSCQGRLLKEKIIYLTKARGLKIPLKRYVISTDHLLPNPAASFANLELPILILYWYLAELIPLNQLDNCLTMGSFDPSGNIYLPAISPKIKTSEQTCLLWKRHKHGEGFPHEIDFELLLEHIPKLNWVSPETSPELA